MMAIEGKKVKKVEGIPPKSADVLKHIELAVVIDPVLLEKRQTPAPVQGQGNSIIS